MQVRELQLCLSSQLSSTAELHPWGFLWIQTKYEKWHAWKYWACAYLLLFMPAVTVLFHFTRLQWQFSGKAHFTLFFSCIFWLMGKARQDAMVLLLWLWSHLNHKHICYGKIVEEKEFILDLFFLVLIKVDIFCSGNLPASCCQEGRFVICSVVSKKTNSAFDQAVLTWQPWPQHVPLALL